MAAAEQGLDWCSLSSPLAIALAQAAKETLQAEEEVVQQQLSEAKNLVATLEDTLDEARGRVLDATFQVGSVLKTFDINGLQVDPYTISCSKHQPYTLQLPNNLTSHREFSDMESGSDDEEDDREEDEEDEEDVDG